MVFDGCKLRKALAPGHGGRDGFPRKAGAGLAHAALENIIPFSHGQSFLSVVVRPGSVCPHLAGPPVAAEPLRRRCYCFSSVNS